MSQNSSIKRPYYTEQMNFPLGASSLPFASKLLTANEMYVACDAFLDVTHNYEVARWLPVKSCRNELARRVQWSSEAKWKGHEEWKEVVRTSLKNVLQQFENIPARGFLEWETVESLESDIHISVLAARKTVEFFHKGERQFLPMPTDLFLVPGHFGEFLASIVAGNIYPMWFGQVDTQDTPGCRDGQYPLYSPREA